MSIRVIDLFSGCGGTSAGLRLAGMRPVAAVDIEPDALATYALNFPEARTFLGDIRSLAVDEIASAIGPPREGERTLLAACAPCQPFSRQHRRKKSDDDRVGLLGEVVRFVEGLEPDHILIENVPDIRRQDQHDGGPLAAFLDRLADLGYQAAVEVLQVADYGVPQSRPRLVVLASRHGRPEFPAPTHGDDRLPYVTVRKAIAHLPPIEAGGSDPSVPNHRAAGLSPINLKRIRATAPGADRRSWTVELQLACHKDLRGYADVYGRMAWDRMAPALTTRCISLSNGRFGHPEQDRAISVREAAAIQSFPDDFTFSGGMDSMARQIGNAVPPLLAAKLAAAFDDAARR